jgi:ferredoxin--NADP+ reductase
VGTLKHNVRRVNALGDGLFILELDRNGLEFVPGDCVTLSTAEGISRPYSISSGTQENRLCFLIRDIPGGEVSPWLKDRKPGDSMDVSNPFGWFRPGQEIGESPFVFIATGTGAAPFLSFQKTFGGLSPTCFLYGVRQAADAVEVDALANWCDLRLAISRGESGPHHAGRLTDLLSGMPLDAGAHYYLCGLESMITEVTAWLEEHGVDLSYTHREVFFHG